MGEEKRGTGESYTKMGYPLKSKQLLIKMGYGILTFYNFLYGQ